MNQRLTPRPRNWAGNFEYGAAHFHEPASWSEVAQIVAGASRVKALGSRHSFNEIADTTGDLIAVGQLNRILELDRVHRTVTIEGGVGYGPLCRYLDRAGFALPNLASLPHISVAGACATGTHGSGVGNGNLATAVSAMEIISGDGETTKLRRGDRDFNGAVVGLGALGIVSQLTLDVVPAFTMTQEVYESLSFAFLQEHFDSVMSSAYSVSLFTDWTNDHIRQVWIKRRTGQDVTGPNLGAAAPASSDRTPIPDGVVENCTPQMGRPGPWHERLPHFRMDFTPSNGDELQCEYFVARSDADAALQAVGSLANQIAPILFISEVRTIAADDLWMSPAFERDSVAIHFTWHPNTPAVTALLPKLEAELAPFEARPHWGKLHRANPSRHYARFPDFRELANRLDPTGKFRNPYLDRLLDENAV